MKPQHDFNHHEPADEQPQETNGASLAKEIAELHERGFDKKGIARKLGEDVKKVRRILADLGLAEIETPPPGSKLDGFRDDIRAMVERGMSGTTILREIRREREDGEPGYQGSITILRNYIREIRGPAKPKAKAYRRFETEPGEEAQVDWSPFRVTIAGVEQVVQCFAMLLGWSRQVFIQFHRDQKLPSLLAAHVAAFNAFGGVTKRVVYDNMATVTLGRRGKEPIWNPRFLPFARHWMFEPWLCRVADPNRKGKDERMFAYMASSLLAGRSFASWEELDLEAEHWMNEVANCRVHGTTREVPAERWQRERSLLTPPPEAPYPTYREETRTVSRDCIVSVGGHRYSAPADLARCTVTVRMHPRHIEVLDARGALRATHRIPDRPGGLVIEQAHYASIRRRPVETVTELDRRFLVVFPGCEAFLDGLKTRMKGLWRIHLGKLEHLVATYGLDHAREAVEQACRFGNFNASAVERILRRRHPVLAVEADEAPRPLQENPEALLDVDSGSLEDYRDLLSGEEDDDGTQGQLAPIS